MPRAPGERRTGTWRSTPTRHTPTLLPTSPVPGEVGEVDEVTLPGADRARAWARELAARGG
ncbi:hypothetical protein [Georgenia yuyongxinii]